MLIGSAFHVSLCLFLGKYTSDTSSVLCLWEVSGNCCYAMFCCPGQRCGTYSNSCNVVWERSWLVSDVGAFLSGGMWFRH